MALTEMQRNMAALMHEIRNQLASFKSNPSFSAPSVVSIHEGYSSGCTVPPSSSVVPSLARLPSNPPISHTVMHAFSDIDVAVCTSQVICSNVTTLGVGTSGVGILGLGTLGVGTSSIAVGD